MNNIDPYTDELIIANLDEQLKQKLTEIFYLDEFCDQIKKNQNNIKILVEETFDYLKEADICLSKKSATTFFKDFLQKVNEFQQKKKKEEEEELEENDSQNEEEEDFSELNDLDGDANVDGLCEICFSSKFLTLHHAIPKLMIKRLKKKKKKAPVIYLKLCRQCHSKLHKTFPHAILAKKYYLIQAILDCDELKDYISDKRRYVEQTEKN